MTATTKVSFGNTVSLSEAADLILAAPGVRYLLQGEPGIGKSSLLSVIKERTGMPVSYVDCGRLELGDVSVPFIDREAGVSRHFPSAMFNLHLGEPVAVMLDEFTKAPRAVQNMLHPLLEKGRPRLADRELPKGSVVILSGNMNSDGVGDNYAGHTASRIVPITVRKPTGAEWIKWGRASGRIGPVVLAWVEKTEGLFMSYLDADPDALKANPFVYNPRIVQRGYVCPRSLETASEIVEGRNSVTSQSALIAALSGAIGEPAARSLMAFVAYADQLPDDEEIAAAPKTCRVPDVPGALHVLVNRLAARAEKSTFAAVMTYMERLPKEWQTIFITTVAATPGTQAVAFSDRTFGQWMARNQALL